MPKQTYVLFRCHFFLVPWSYLPVYTAENVIWGHKSSILISTEVNPFSSKQTAIVQKQSKYNTFSS